MYELFANSYFFFLQLNIYYFVANDQIHFLFSGDMLHVTYKITDHILLLKLITTIENIVRIIFNLLSGNLVSHPYAIDEYHKKANDRLNGSHRYKNITKYQTSTVIDMRMHCLFPCKIYFDTDSVFEKLIMNICVGLKCRTIR